MDHNWYEKCDTTYAQSSDLKEFFPYLDQVWNFYKHLIRICEVVWLTFMLILIDHHIEQKLGTKVSQNILTHRDVQYDSFSACDWSTSTKLVVSFVYSEVTLLTQLVKNKISLPVQLAWTEQNVALYLVPTVCMLWAAK